MQFSPTRGLVAEDFSRNRRRLNFVPSQPPPRILSSTFSSFRFPLEWFIPLRENPSALASDILTEIRPRISQILRLPENWDSEGSKSVDQDEAVRLLRLLVDWKAHFGADLTVPDVFPTRSGHVLAEWLGEGRGLQIETSPGGWIVVATEKTSHGSKYGQTTWSFDDPGMANAYEWYLGRRLWVG